MEPFKPPNATTPRKPKKQQVDQSLRELRGFAVDIRPTPPPQPSELSRRIGNSRDIPDPVPTDNGTPMTVGTAFPSLAATKAPAHMYGQIGYGQTVTQGPTMGYDMGAHGKHPSMQGRPPHGGIFARDPRDF